ncbi:MAG: acyl carrier protein [Candidatus Promineifilaceae bacterium]
MDNIEQQLKDFISQEFLGDKPGTVSASDNLIEDGIIDSLAILMLIKYIEDQFSVTIEPEDVTLDNFESVGTISRLIEKRNTQ